MELRPSWFWPAAERLDPAASITYLVCGLSVVALVIAITLRGPIGWNDAAFGALVGSPQSVSALAAPFPETQPLAVEG